jgi:hypothetical protein
MSPRWAVGGPHLCPTPVRGSQPAALGRKHSGGAAASRAVGDLHLDRGRFVSGDRWQVGRLTKTRTGIGAVTIDLTEAEIDDWDVEIVVPPGGHDATGHRVAL